MRWTKVGPEMLRCAELDATITHHPDRFVVQVGNHTREHYSFLGARMLAERMHREIEEFDHWGERKFPAFTKASLQHRGEKLLTSLSRRAVMASLLALFAGVAGVLFGFIETPSQHVALDFRGR